MSTLPDNNTRNKLVTFALAMLTAFGISYVFYVGFLTLLNIVNRITVDWSDLLFLLFAYLILGFLKFLFWNLKPQERMEKDV